MTFWVKSDGAELKDQLKQIAAPFVMKLKTIILERLESQVVEIMKLKTDLEAQTARSTKLRKWWDDETETSDRLTTQSEGQDLEINNLKREKESWELERATLLRKVENLESKLTGMTLQYEAAIE